MKETGERSTLHLRRTQVAIAVLVILTIVLIGGIGLSVTPYKLQAKVLPEKFSMFYAGSYESIIGDKNDNFTEKYGYALQLGRLQMTYMKVTGRHNLHAE